MQPRFYISSSQDKGGSLQALFYYNGSDPDVYGWHVESKGHYFSAGFFMVESFYSSRPTRFYRSMHDDVYGPWVIDYPPAHDEFRCPVTEPVCHELQSMQSRFIEEWLFFRDSPEASPDILAYREHAMPIQEVNIRWKRLPRFGRQGTQWTCAAVGIDLNLPDLLRKYWRLSEKIPER
jgi:hypothetical protein